MNSFIDDSISHMKNGHQQFLEATYGSCFFDWSIKNKAKNVNLHGKKKKKQNQTNPHIYEQNV